MKKETRIARDGFSLIEVVVATAIIGMGVASLMVAVQSGSQGNDAGQKLTQAVFLGQELREWTLKLPFSDPDPEDQGNPPGPDGANPQTFVDDLDDLMGVTYSPPRDGQGSPIADMTDWSQQIDITWRSLNNLSTIVSPGTSDVVNVQITISHNGQAVLTNRWLVTRR